MFTFHLDEVFYMLDILLQFAFFLNLNFLFCNTNKLMFSVSIIVLFSRIQ